MVADKSMKMIEIDIDENEEIHSPLVDHIQDEKKRERKSSQKQQQQTAQLGSMDNAVSINPNPFIITRVIHRESNQEESKVEVQCDLETNLTETQKVTKNKGGRPRK